MSYHKVDEVLVLNRKNVNHSYGRLVYTWISDRFFSDIAFDVDDIIDISELRGYGLQSGEEELPDLVDERQNGNYDK